MFERAKRVVYPNLPLDLFSILKEATSRPTDGQRR
jgi:hypothetical protein